MGLGVQGRGRARGGLELSAKELRGRPWQARHPKARGQEGARHFSGTVCGSRIECVTRRGEGWSREETGTRSLRV